MASQADQRPDHKSLKSTSTPAVLETLKRAYLLYELQQIVEAVFIRWVETAAAAASGLSRRSAIMTGCPLGDVVLALSLP